MQFRGGTGLRRPGVQPPRLRVGSDMGQGLIFGCQGEGGPGQFTQPGGIKSLSAANSIAVLVFLTDLTAVARQVSGP